jgi:uroporphyrinogen-III decarboxylase
MPERMTLRERILSVLRGDASDRIPWNVYGWLVPDGEASRRLHAQGLGWMGTRRIYREINHDVVVRKEERLVDGEAVYHTTIETPLGTLTQQAVRESNYGSLWIRKFFITSAADYPAAEFFFRHTSFEPDYEPWLEAEMQMGDGGFVIGEVMPIPIMTLMVNWMGVEGLTEGIYDHTGGFESLLDALDAHYARQNQLAAEGPAEIIWWGDNVTGSIISPRLFERYVAPVYAKTLPVLRSAGKIPIAHYDGSNRPLVKNLARTALPVIEAFTPPPWGDLSVAEAKAAWPDKVVGVNFPGALFLEPAEVIYDYALKLVEEAAPGGRFILGCTEDFPMVHFEKTFSAIGRALAEYEGVPF